MCLWLGCASFVLASSCSLKGIRNSLGGEGGTFGNELELFDRAFFSCAYILDGFGELFKKPYNNNNVGRTIM